jgi:hypothetical protein
MFMWLKDKKKQLWGYKGKHAHLECGFESWSPETEDYKNNICCFSIEHAALRSKNKDWLTQNQDDVSNWRDVYTYRLLFQWASTIKIQLSVLI